MNISRTKLYLYLLITSSSVITISNVYLKLDLVKIHSPSAQLLVITSMLLAMDAPFIGKRTFLGEYLPPDKKLKNNEKDRLNKLDSFDSFNGERQWKPYKHQFGLQAAVFSSLVRLTPDKLLSGTYSLNIFRYGLSFIFTISLISAFKPILESIGSIWAYIGFTISLFSVWFTVFSANIYWVGFVYPASVWLMWNARSNKGIFNYVVICTFIKSLIGYEYITFYGFILLVPLIFNVTVKTIPIKLFIEQSSLVFVGFTLGLALAILIHGEYLAYLSDGSLISGLMYIYDGIAARVDISALGLANNATEQELQCLNKSALSETMFYFTASKILFNLPILFYMAIALILFVINEVFFRWQRLLYRGLFILITWSELAAVSWILLAPGHSGCHHHLNPILTALFGLTFTTVFISSYLGFLGRRIYELYALHQGEP